MREPERYQYTKNADIMEDYELGDRDALIERINRVIRAIKKEMEK